MLDKQKFYWGTSRKAIVAFGNLFKNVEIMREDSQGNAKTVKVPISYAPRDKFLARIQQQPNLDTRNVAIVIPCMAFEMGALQFDHERMKNANNKQSGTVNGVVIRKYNPVPYNMSVNLYVYTKTQDEGLQIVEQILPTFRPAYTLSMQAIPEMGLDEDLHIILESVGMEDNYEGDMSDTRSVIWTFSFTLQLNYHPTADNTQRGLIKRTEVSFFGDNAMTAQTGQIVSEVTPPTAGPNDDYTVATTFDGFD